MITQIEARFFRGLRFVRQPVAPFQVLVGPNGSGKSSFFDVVAFVRDVVEGQRDGLERAVESRSSSFADLVWNREVDGFEIAVEAAIPSHLGGLLRPLKSGIAPTHVRYELRVKPGADLQPQIDHEVLRLQASESTFRQPELFPEGRVPPPTLFRDAPERGAYKVLNKARDGGDSFYSEVYAATGKGWTPTFKLGPRKSALANLPDDTEKFPVASWFRSLVADGVRPLMLNSALLRLAAAPNLRGEFRPDGSNLAWTIHGLRQSHPERIGRWVNHLKSALPRLMDVRSTVREDDKHCWLSLVFEDGQEFPSWVASDGTLRLLALTLPAYIPDLTGIYLVEEPENGIHPRAVETALRSLQSVYKSQVLVATHSPVIVGLADPSEILCFSRTSAGIADVVRGSEHPELRRWIEASGDNLGVLYAAGYLS